jgi:hypothetical protein
MSFDMHAAARETTEHCLRLVAAGPGWHDYTEDKAKRLAKEDPAMYGELPLAVRHAIRAQTQSTNRRS